MTAAEKNTEWAADRIDQAAAVREDAERVTAQLAFIRQALRKSILARSRWRSLSLTTRQVLVMQLLVEHRRDTEVGMSLTELSRRMGLAHSTVSDIISRLERRNLLCRVPRTDDRRFVSIELTKPVLDWLTRELPISRLDPLETVLRIATTSERATILAGLTTLERLLRAGTDDIG